MYRTYSCSTTQKYKCGYIHSAIIGGNEVIKCQVDAYAYVIYAKSVRAAKQLITKHSNKIRGIK
jgi:hypothetical protein